MEKLIHQRGRKPYRDDDVTITNEHCKKRIRRKTKRNDSIKEKYHANNNNNDHNNSNDNIGHDNDKESNIVIRWITSIAFLGDSVISLVIATIVLLISIVISIRLNDENDIGRFFYQQLHNTNNTTNGIPPRVSSRNNFVDSDVIEQSDELYEALGPIPDIDPPYIFTVQLDEFGKIQFNENDTYKKLHDAFYKDGVVAIRGLLSDEMLRQLDDESSIVIQKEIDSQTAGSPKQQLQHQQKKKLQFFTVKHSIMFQNNTNQSLSAFAKVAIRSSIPSIVARLFYNITNEPSTSDNVVQMESKPKNRKKNLRILRDIFLAKDNGQFICGWHVDDMGFWPATQDSPVGINVWVAIDDMPPLYGGGFAVAVQSHVAQWRHQAHAATGSSMYFPLPNGYTDASHMVSNRTGAGTCNIHQVAPHLHKRMEETSRVYNIQRGDIIIHTRWLFHRTIPFNITTNDYSSSGSSSSTDDFSDDRIYRRYSIRYSPGSSIIPPGYGFEYSVLWNESNGGISADDVCTDDDNTPWYPLAWQEPVPSKEPILSTSTTTRTSIDNRNKQTNEKEDEEAILAQQFANLVERKFPIVEKLAQQRRKEMQRLLAQQQRQQNSRN